MEFYAELSAAICGTKIRTLSCAEWNPALTSLDSDFGDERDGGPSSDDESNGEASSDDESAFEHRNRACHCSGESLDKCASAVLALTGCCSACTGVLLLTLLLLSLVSEVLPLHLVPGQSALIDMLLAIALPTLSPPSMPPPGLPLAPLTLPLQPGHPPPLPAWPPTPLSPPPSYKPSLPPLKPLAAPLPIIQVNGENEEDADLAAPLPTDEANEEEEDDEDLGVGALSRGRCAAMLSDPQNVFHRMWGNGRMVRQSDRQHVNMWNVMTWTRHRPQHYSGTSCFWAVIVIQTGLRGRNPCAVPGLTTTRTGSTSARQRIVRRSRVTHQRSWDSTR